MSREVLAERERVNACGAAGAAPDPARIAAGVEAILLTADRPVPAARLAEALGLSAPGSSADAPSGRVSKACSGLIEQAVESLNSSYGATGRSFRIELVAGGYRLMTLPSLAPVLAAFHGGRAASRLSRAAVEALAIIAYKQPLTRAHLEAIRGVACGEVLRSLLERRLVTILGRAEELGRPILYGTTREFLDLFGLASLKDLPTLAEFQGQI
jgi:segregation and condensation protein B